MKVAPYRFSGPNWLYGAFVGKIVPDENVAQFCLKSPLVFVFPKNTFSVWIFVLNRTSPNYLAKRTRLYDGGKGVPEWSFVHPKKQVFGWNFRWNRPHTSFLGPIRCMARLGAKLYRSEASSILKNTFSIEIFWSNRPHTSFLGLIGYMVRSGAKLFRTKTLLNFASKALSYSFFQKTRFRFEFLY